MKKINFLIALAALLTVGLSSCREAEQKQDQNVAYKIQYHEALTDDDYARMIMYVGDYAEKSQKYVDDIINDQNLAEAHAGMDRLNEEYPLVNTFRNCLRITPMSKFNDDNKALLQKYSGYIEFTEPQGMTIVTDDKAAGLEVATPNSGVDNGVVAGAVDEVKEKER